MPSALRAAIDDTRTVFSSQEKVNKRSSTIRKFDRKIYWLVEKNSDGTLKVTRLNKKNLPTAEVHNVSLKELIEEFTPEPEYYSRAVHPILHKIEETVNRGDEFREQEDHSSASYEYGNALDLDVENIRANFGAALVFLAQGETTKANIIFNRLVKMDGTFQEQHKHLFNEFGISMRKSKMYKQAIAYYKRALELTQEDENLHINIARPLCEQKMFASAAQHLIEALRLCPGHRTAIEFLSWLREQKVIPLRLEPAVKEALEGKPAPQQADEFTLPDNLFQ